MGKKMTRGQALAEFKESGVLSTGLLEPLGISFEVWLRYCSVPHGRVADINARLIAFLERQEVCDGQTLSHLG